MNGGERGSAKHEAVGLRGGGFIVRRTDSEMKRSGIERAQLMHEHEIAKT